MNVASFNGFKLKITILFFCELSKLDCIGKKKVCPP